MTSTEVETEESTKQNDKDCFLSQNSVFTVSTEVTFETEVQITIEEIVRFVLEIV